MNGYFAAFLIVLTVCVTIVLVHLMNNKRERDRLPAMQQVFGKPSNEK